VIGTSLLTATTLPAISTFDMEGDDIEIAVVLMIDARGIGVDP
jgi:hypothetical protein